MNAEIPLCELGGLANEGFDLIKSIDSALTSGLTVHETYNDILFDTIKSEFQSMESALNLMDLMKYKDSFIILRTVFEKMLYFWLMIKGKKYRFDRTFTISPLVGHTVKKGRDNTFEKWHEDWEKGKKSLKDVIKMNKQDNDKIIVTYEREGLYDNEDNKIYPFYTFVLADHYDPSTRFNADLNSIKEGIIYPKISEKIAEQKKLYHNYIYYDSIIKNLKLNKIITNSQCEYVKVHYNFLSRYVHPTKHSIRDFTHDISENSKCKISDYIIKEQILLYVCIMQANMLENLIDKFESENPNADIKKYKELIMKLKNETKHFWFIDNEPTNYDRQKSNVIKNTKQHFTKSKTNDTLLYYEDPLKRLNELKNFQQSRHLRNL